jgi:dTDP-4-dehydrorhamnose reductase
VWLLIGGSGQLGRELERVLSTQGINFIAVSSKDLDITLPSTVSDYILQTIPSVIINAAAWTDVDGAESNPDAAYAVNCFGAINLAIAARRVNAKFAHVSTDYVFSGNSFTPWRESDPQDPISVYGQSKAGGEVGILQEYSECSYIFRTAWLYSQHGRNFAKTMIRLAKSSDGEVQVVDNQFGQPTSAVDLAEQIVATIVGELPYGIYHATNGGRASWFEFAKEIFTLIDYPIARVIPVDASSYVRKAKRPAYSVLSHEGWNVVGKAGQTVLPMRDWRLALASSIDQILGTCEGEGESNA